MLADDPVWAEKAQVASGQRHNRDRGRGRPEWRCAAAAHRRLPFGLLDAAWPEAHELPKKLLRDAGCGEGRPGAIRCGWAGTYRASARPAAPCDAVANETTARRDRFGQFRLHRQYRVRHRHTDCTYR